ncbi:DUF4123 domain-containing protein [Marinobacter sp. CHS3-4]|uniref:DUF4123 domain-containing protein n=1 Tax=Marinobacter sp. CHS3-4 TaxID=3045174 RepID=UPI0024B49817|nr:DUF4123 domain-containing protein [Marinobacter sp. CHS3-4]MDI9243996.1 DUF4123 domain-containing protein [Marinobacter sp. CHS3-4]
MTMREPGFNTSSEPEEADFALLDLAQKDENQLLSWLYQHFDRGEITWESLYQGTELADLWKSGPILIDLRDQTDFCESLIQRYQREPLGMLITAPSVILADLAVHLRSLTTVSVDGKPTLLRYYDPRSTGPLLKVLEPGQKARLIGPARQWHWYRYGKWWQSLEVQAEPAPEQSAPFAITGAQVKEMDDARVRQFATVLADNYRVHIPAEDAEQFALNEVLKAQQAGINLQADQDRWLRMAIRLKGPLLDSPDWKQLAENSNRTAAQILSQLECEQGL